LKGRPIGRKLSSSEVTELERIDHEFWCRELAVDGVFQRRSELAIVYDPTPDWNFFDLVDEVFVPRDAVEQVQAIVGNNVTVHPLN
jgi:hypothetical protein